MGHEDHDVNPLSRRLGASLGRWLSRPRHAHSVAAPVDIAALRNCLQAGDVVLVEGHSRFSVAIKFLTQSTWSHAAIHVGNATGLHNTAGEPLCLVEADVVEGVRAVALSAWSGMNVRVCRAASLNPAERERLVAYAVSRLGHRYDLKNIVDLLRYLLPTPPVPQRWRRRMLALGSGDPTRAVCSTLIAQAFQSVHYPVLPVIEHRPKGDPMCPACVDEILHVRHHSLFVPRDFDVSPYFEVIKPSLASGFDHHTMHWSQAPTGAQQT
jgi:hypothetical protein